MREFADWPVRDLIAHRADATPDRTAVVAAETGEAWTYAAFDRAVGAVASQLADLATPDAGRVGLLLSTRVETALAMHAVHRLGRAAVLLGPDQPQDALHDRVERAPVDALVCEADTEATARSLADRADVALASVDDADDPSVAALDETATATVDPAPLDRSDVAVVAFTSGTTGTPKAVPLTHGNLVASATASAFRLGVAPGDRWLCCLPMHHLGGLSPVVRSALYGSTVVVQREPDAEATAEALATHAATGVSLVPTQLRRLLASDWRPPDGLRFVLLGGAPASADLLERALAADVPVCPTYGMTETASQVATARPETVRQTPDTVGQPLVFTTVTVLDEDGDTLPAGEAGELVVEGPTVTPGYLQGKGDAFGPHGFHTGDVGVRDEDGRIRILGRLDDRIVTGGETVQPATVEAALREHPSVREAAVVGLADPEWGERVGALVVADDASPGDLRGFCRDRLPDHAVPKTITLAASLPRTASGTVDRAAVRNRLTD